MEVTFLTNEDEKKYVQLVNGKTGVVQLGAADVGAEPLGTAAAGVSGHNVSADAHNDLRLELKAISQRLNGFFDSDDQTLDALSEIVAYIKSNKTLIDAITASKVSVSDIVDDLITNAADKPLSAAQGVALKGLVDAIPAWAKAASKPGYTKSEVGLGNVENVKQYSASNPPPYPVTSVNGQTGAVTLECLTVTGVDADGNSHSWTVYGVAQ